MLNEITLIGTVVDGPSYTIDPYGGKEMTMKLSVPSPPDAPPTHWALMFDLRPLDTPPYWHTGDSEFLVVSRDPTLLERTLQSVRQGDLVYVEGRLVLTGVSSHVEVVPVAEILASEVLVLKEMTQS